VAQDCLNVRTRRLKVLLGDSCGPAYPRRVKWIRQLRWHIGETVVVVLLVGFLGGMWLRSELAERDARSTLHEALPADSKIIAEKIYACSSDDGAPPFCGTADVRLPGVTGSACKATLLDDLNAHGYHVLYALSNAEAERGRDRIFVEPSIDWCNVSVRYSR
jgi:hypothetical protein